jgi:phosphotransferase family enzyme
MTIPHGATAVRLQYDGLPGGLQRKIEDRLGASVRSAASCDSGFTSGLASRLLLSDGRRVFVKAAREGGEWPVASSYREEVRKLTLLPAAVPAPRLRWHFDDGTWVVLCFDDVGGRPPQRPWRREELTVVLGAVSAMAEALTPAPAGLATTTVAGELADERARWSRLRADLAVPPVLAPHVDEAERLARSALGRCAGDTLVHLDLRDDNIVIGDDGRVWVCDWNWPAVGAAWIDLVTLLISASGDGLDATGWLEQTEEGRRADPESVDALLALLYGYFATAGAEPVPEASPFIRIHQRWYADATLGWLAERRGWS